MPSSIQFHRLLDPRYIVDLKSTTKREALGELAGLLHGDPRLADPDVFLDAIHKREELVSTGVGLGVAIPHVKIPEVRDYVVAVGRRADGIEFDALDSQPVRLIFMIGASEGQSRDFVKLLARVIRMLKNGATRLALLEASIPEGFIEVIRRDDEASAG